MHEPVIASARRQSGVSLIEVMVAMVIFALALLGVAQVQWRALQETQLAERRGRAALEAANQLECMRARRAIALTGAYDIDFAAEPSKSADPADAERSRWRARLAEQGGDRGSITTDATGGVRIGIRSDESHLGGAMTTWFLESRL